MADKPVKVAGGCLCGEVRYEAQAFLRSGYICHCRVCQKSTGQPAEIDVPIKVGSLKFVKGAPRFYASSTLGRRGFCGDCGSRLVWVASSPENDCFSCLTVGSLDNSADVVPVSHIFVDARLPWYHLDESLLQYRESDWEGLLKKWRQERLEDQA